MLSVLSVVRNSSHSAVGIVLQTTPPGNRELHPSSSHFDRQGVEQTSRSAGCGGLWPRTEWEEHSVNRKVGAPAPRC